MTLVSGKFLPAFVRQLIHVYGLRIGVFFDAALWLVFYGFIVTDYAKMTRG